MFRRTKLLLGNKFELLKKSKIIVFGIGGVGGYAVEMLVRAGVQNITIVDFDVVDISNKNRQIIALDSTIGKPKVDVLKQRILDINPDCYVTAINKKLTKDNIADFNICDYDFVIDAIDMVTSKIALIEFAHSNNVPIISSMGAGNRYEIPKPKIVDIFSTYNDGLAKVLRKKLREKGILSYNVVFDENKAHPSSDEIGSISYYPAIIGSYLSAYVINKIIERGEDYGSRNNE